MESLYQLLQGSYGYLLIFQILVVTGLFVSFLWMMAQRTKNAYYALSPSADGTVSTHATASLGITPSEYQQLKEKCARLEEENSKVTALKEEYEGLLQKVKFLESKLLEYEILQEEIGTLSSLKVENEKLKGELQTLQREIAGSKGKSSAMPTMPEIPAASAEAPAAMPDLGAVPNLDFSTTNPTPPAVAMDAAAAPAINADAFPPGMDLSAADVPTPPPPGSDDGLEGLLKQIDSLTQQK